MLPFMSQKELEDMIDFEGLKKEILESQQQMLKAMDKQNEESRLEAFHLWDTVIAYWSARIDAAKKLFNGREDSWLLKHGVSPIAYGKPKFNYGER